MKAIELNHPLVATQPAKAEAEKAKEDVKPEAFTTQHTVSEQSAEQPVIPIYNQEENEVDSNYIPVIEVTLPLEDVTPGRYRHYKGNEYEVVSIAKHSETLEKLVIYYDVNTHQYWARPYDMFIELVENNGKFIRRFDKLS